MIRQSSSNLRSPVTMINASVVNADVQNARLTQDPIHHLSAVVSVSVLLRSSVFHLRRWSSSSSTHGTDRHRRKGPTKDQWRA